MSQRSLKLTEAPGGSAHRMVWGVKATEYGLGLSFQGIRTFSWRCWEPLEGGGDFAEVHLGILILELTTTFSLLWGSDLSPLLTSPESTTLVQDPKDHSVAASCVSLPFLVRISPKQSP